MIKERRRITFRKELKVSKFRLWGGFVVSLLLSFTAYLFFTTIRDLYRIFSLADNFDYLKFTSEELLFYNLFYAFLGLLIGLHFFIKIALDTNKQFFEQNRQISKRKTVANQNSLLWYFMAFFSKMVFIYGGFIMSSFGFDRNFNLNLFNHINFYDEYNYLFVLVIIVLLIQSLTTTLISIRDKLIIILFITLFALLFSQINLLDIEALLQIMKNK